MTRWGVRIQSTSTTHKFALVSDMTSSSRQTMASASLPPLEHESYGFFFFLYLSLIIPASSSVIPPIKNKTTNNRLSGLWWVFCFFLAQRLFSFIGSFYFYFSADTLPSFPLSPCTFLLSATGRGNKNNGKPGYVYKLGLRNGKANVDEYSPIYSPTSSRPTVTSTRVTSLAAAAVLGVIGTGAIAILLTSSWPRNMPPYNGHLSHFCDDRKEMC